MLLLVASFVMVSSALADVLEPLLFQFLTEFINNVLQWRWVVIIEERYEDINPLLVNQLLERNVSVTILTSHIKPAMQRLLRTYDTVPVLLLVSPKVENRSFLFDTCRIHWVVFLPDYSTEVSFIESAKYLTRLHVVFVTPQPDEVFSLQVPTENSSSIQVVNSWHPATSFENSFAFRQCSVKSVGHLRIAMEKHFPFFRPGNSTHPPGGSDIKLLDSLAASLKFTYTVVRPPDGSWGTRNGSKWSGMIGMLVRNEADAALSGMSVNYERQKAVQFSVYCSFDRVTFVTRKPAKMPKTWAIFWPYTAEVWILLALYVFGIAALLTWLQTRMKRRKQIRLRYQDSLLYIFQSILNQGYYDAREPRCRVLMTFWWGFCITLIAGYNGSLMSFMAHPGLSPAVDTILKLVDAVRKGEMSVGTIENSADHAVFRNSEEKDLRLILKNMESDPRNFVRHDVVGLRETLRRRYAYVGGWLTVQADVWDPRLFVFAKDSFLHFGYAIAFAPGFDYVDVFNRKILQLGESGLIQKWILDMIERNQQRGDTSGDFQRLDSDDAEASNNVLTIDDVQGAFAVLVIGLFLSIVCCIAENCIFWGKRSQKDEVFQRWR